MINRVVSLLLLGAVPLLSGCFGLRSGEVSSYPDYEGDDVDKAVLTPENHEDPWVTLGEFKLNEDACEGIETPTATTNLSYGDLGRFLDAQGMTGIEIKARNDLYWYEFPGEHPNEGDRIRLRLAVLPDSKQAAAELHKSLLEHGPGWWGLRRSNLSVLAPKAGVSEAMAFALKYKLLCWGMFEMADADDVYVVPGPYMEL